MAYCSLLTTYTCSHFFNIFFIDFRPAMCYGKGGEILSKFEGRYMSSNADPGLPGVTHSSSLVVKPYDPGGVV